ncbi:30S ribosomal protein S16 [bacterium]|nr:30S ribosomal protein S16 [bacterium]
MSVTIRLTRLGRKKRPFYRIIAVDSRRRRDGAYLEKIGYYDPVARPAIVEVDHDKALKWLNRGAKPSDTVRSLFRREGVMMRWDMSKRDYTQEQIEEAVKAHRDKNYAVLAKEAPPKPEPLPEPEPEEVPSTDAKAKKEPQPEAPAEASKDAEATEAPADEAAAKDDKAEEKAAEAPAEEAKPEKAEPKEEAPAEKPAEEAKVEGKADGEKKE